MSSLIEESLHWIFKSSFRDGLDWIGYWMDATIFEWTQTSIECKRKHKQKQATVCVCVWVLYRTDDYVDYLDFMNSFFFTHKDIFLLDVVFLFNSFVKNLFNDLWFEKQKCQPNLYNTHASFFHFFFFYFVKIR